MKRDERRAGALGESEDAAKATLALLRRYVLQETVEPLRHLLKRTALGVAASIVTGVGVVALLLALLRVLQTETGGALTGTWSFAPYLLTCVAALGLVGVAGLLAYRAVASRRRGG